MNGVVMGIILSEETLMPVPVAGELIVTNVVDEIAISHNIDSLSVGVEIPEPINIAVEVDEIMVVPEG